MLPKSLRDLPSVHELLESPPLKALIERVSKSTVISAVGAMLDEIGREVKNAATEATMPSVSDLAERIAQRIADKESAPLRPVVNATGVLLHGQLGPVPLADEAVTEMLLVARDYTDAHEDLPAGRSSRRMPEMESLLRELTGAEAALAVHGKAGATILLSAALAAGREVVVARSQLGENADGCRLSEMIVAGGAVLREVGAVNHVRLDDYTQAVGDATAAIMFAHPSNYSIAGNTGGVGLRELVDAARRRKLALIHDVGLGALLDADPFGFADQPNVGDSIKAGVDIVLFRGDGLLGGPPCGIIVGRKALVEQIERHPVAGAMRVEHLTRAALTATLRLYRDAEKVRLAIPLLRLLTTSADNLKNRAERLAMQAAAVPAIAEAQAVASESCVGGGASSKGNLPTWCVSLRPAAVSVDDLAAALWAGEPSVVGRVRQDCLLFDLRSVFPRQDTQLLAALEALGRTSEAASQP